MDGTLISKNQEINNLVQINHFQHYLAIQTRKINQMWALIYLNPQTLQIAKSSYQPHVESTKSIHPLKAMTRFVAIARILNASSSIVSALKAECSARIVIVIIALMPTKMKSEPM